MAVAVQHVLLLCLAISISAGVPLPKSITGHRLRSQGPRALVTMLQPADLEGSAAGASALLKSVLRHAPGYFQATELLLPQSAGTAVSPELLQRVRAAGWHVREVPAGPQPQQQAQQQRQVQQQQGQQQTQQQQQQVPANTWWHAKLHMWSMLEFHEVVFMDPSAVFVSPLLGPFTAPAPYSLGCRLWLPRGSQAAASEVQKGTSTQGSSEEGSSGDSNTAQGSSGDSNTAGTGGQQEDSTEGSSTESDSGESGSGERRRLKAGSIGKVAGSSGAGSTPTVPVYALHPNAHDAGRLQQLLQSHPEWSERELLLAAFDSSSSGSSSSSNVGSSSDGGMGAESALCELEDEKSMSVWEFVASSEAVQRRVQVLHFGGGDSSSSDSSTSGGGAFRPWQVQQQQQQQGRQGQQQQQQQQKKQQQQQQQGQQGQQQQQQQRQQPPQQQPQKQGRQQPQQQQQRRQGQQRQQLPQQRQQRAASALSGCPAALAEPCRLWEAEAESNSWPVTIVTALHTGPNNKHTTDEYREWGRHFMSQRVPMVVVSDDPSKVPFIDTREPALTRTMRVGVDDFLVSHSAFDKHYSYQQKINPQAGLHNVFLFKVWLEKTAHVMRAIEANPFNSSHYVWVDYGAFRDPAVWSNGDWKPHTDRFPTHNRILLLRAPHDDPVKQVGGGIIGGSVHAWQLWSHVFFNTLQRELRAGNFVGDDQAVMTIVASQHPHLVCVVSPLQVEGRDAWFYLQDYLAGEVPVEGRCSRWGREAVYVHGEVQHRSV